LCNVQDAKSGKCLAAAALFTEIVGQTSYFYVYNAYSGSRPLGARFEDRFFRR